MLTVFLVIIGVIAIMVVYIIYVFNRLVIFRNRVKEAWSDIDVQLKRRYDLIPNLIETVKGYAAHEKEVFEKVTEARAKAISANGVAQKAETENQLADALKTLFAVSENYPQLRASENFLKLQEELSDTENKIQASWRFYNANVMAFNTKQEVFPINLMVTPFGFQKAEFFEIEESAEREAPKVNFS
ncbi:MAG: LemA family protein [Candidatus Portnoybacteria bacterium]|nr:LemA family protein [Candidatus Portnoybacteria bacterium]